jgi:hypothetical protein
MPTPIRSREAIELSCRHRIPPPPAHSRSSEWRCTSCNKLLGIHLDGRMHLRFARGHEYFVAFPIVATCRSCTTLNHAAAPAR